MKTQNLLIIVAGIIILTIIICMCCKSEMITKPVIIISGEKYDEIVSPKTMKMTVFVKYASDYFMKESVFKNIIEQCKIPYNIEQSEGSYRWYKFYAEGKEFHIGFAREFIVGYQIY